MKYEMYKTLPGSNDHILRVKVNKPRARAGVAALLLFGIIIPLGLYILAGDMFRLYVFPFVDNTFRVVAYAPTKLISPLAIHPAKVYAAEPSEHDLITGEVKQVFGDYSDKAFKVIGCENKALNPNAVNVNTDPEHTRDIGIFQINNKWQGVTNEAFLKDYHINIRMAWSIFSRDHYSFKLWSCSKKVGLN